MFIIRQQKLFGMYFIRYLDSEGHIDVQKLIINHE